VGGAFFCAGGTAPPATASGTDLASGPNSCHGPAANAKTYVLMGLVSEKVFAIEYFSGNFVMRSGFSIGGSSLFEITSHPVGATTSNLNLAFRSGWSNTGNAVLASDGTKSE